MRYNKTIEKEQQTDKNQEGTTMTKYTVKLRASAEIEAAINQEITATFELSAISESAAKFRAMKMMSYIIDGYIEDKNLNPALADDGCQIIEVKEI